MFAVQVRKINIGKSQQFVTAQKKANEIIKAKSKTPIYYNAGFTEDNRYAVSTPINSFADLDKIAANLQANYQLVDAEIKQQIAACIEWEESFVMQEVANLSIPPAEGMDLSDFRFNRFQHFYFHPKDRQKVYATLKKINDYWVKQEGNAFHFTYQPLFGKDLNQLVIHHIAKDLAGIAGLNTKERAHQKKPEYIALVQELLPLITKVETEYSWSQPDLSMSKK